MKAAISFVTLYLISFSMEQTQEEMTKYINDCIESTKVNPSLVQKALLEGNFVQDQNLKCFLKCLFVSMGDMNETGEMMMDMLKSQAPKHLTEGQVDEIVEKCKDIGGSDPCDIAYKVAECIINETTNATPSDN